MRIILVGCEYAGKTVLAGETSRWLMETMGLPSVRWHDHFVFPHLTRHFIVPHNAVAVPDAEETGDDMLLSRPALLEQLQRHMIWHHLHPTFYRDEDDYPMINWYYADAVYAPLYYGYGEAGTFADRRRRARIWVPR